MREIQTLLGRIGYIAGTADGIPGSQTKLAVRRYQQDFGLPVNGEPSRELLNHLRTVVPR